MGLNTTLKGDTLENEVFEIITGLLNRGEFFVSSGNSKIYQKKAYYSADREDDIIFDLSIETFRADATKYSLLTLIEVKNYASSIPVNDIEEFDAKIRQIGRHNTKGLLITNAPLQKSALNLARKFGIAVARIGGDKAIEWLAERRQNSMLNYDYNFVEEYLTDETKTRDSFIALSDGQTSHSLPDLLLKLGVVDNFQLPQDNFLIPYWSEEAFDNKIEQLNLLKCFAGLRLDTDRLCEWISILYDVDFDLDNTIGVAGNMSILGKLNYEPLSIQVNRELKPDIHRWRFTLVHEIAHLIIHYPILNSFRYSLQDTANNFNLGAIHSNDTVKRIELQANLMAGQILLPKNILLHQVAQYFKEENIHTGFLYVDHQPQNQQLLFKLLEKLSALFQVSMEVVKLRLKRLHLLQDKYEQSISSVLKEQGYKIW